MGITWGAWTSPNAQKWANIPCAAFGLILAIVGIGALVGMARTDVEGLLPPPAQTEARSNVASPAGSVNQLRWQELVSKKLI
jgi:succinate dehydrogenase / fumarate reductase cytochrome b subunit